LYDMEIQGRYKMDTHWENDIALINSDLENVVQFLSHNQQKNSDLLKMEMSLPRFNGNVLLHHAINNITSEFHKNCEKYTTEGATPSYYLELYTILLQGWPMINRLFEIQVHTANDMVSQRIDSEFWFHVAIHCHEVKSRMERLMSVLCWTTRMFRDSAGYAPFE
jgi:hypothetical protein